MSIEVPRNLKGCAHPKAKLQPGQDEEIRQRFAAGEKDSSLAREYRVHRRTIFRIIVGQSYPPE